MIENLKCKDCGHHINAREYIEFDGRCPDCAEGYLDMIRMKARAYEESEREGKSDE